MTSYDDGRAELAAAIVAAGVRVAGGFGSGEPPYAAVLSDGIGDFRTIATGRVPWQYRVGMVAASGHDADAAGAELATMTTAVLAAALGLAGWQLVRLDRQGLRDIAGAPHYSADLILARMIDL